VVLSRQHATQGCFARQEVLLQISPDAEALEDVDGEFYGYPDDLADLLA
jgi:hypothetical protein